MSKVDTMDKALQTMINNIPEKTGKKLEEWIELLNEKNFQKHTEAVKFLKTEHGVTHGFANTIVTLSKENNGTCEDLVLIQYKGKESLKPLYKTRIDLGLKLKGVEVQGCLENSGPFGTMCTHRIQLKNISDIDSEVIKWLSMAYEKSI